MSRYGNVKAGAYNKLNVDSESSDTSEKLNDVERVLNKMGISIRKTNLEFKDFDDVLDEIADKWGTLDNVTKRALANAFAGVRQNEAFLVLMENYDKYQELLEVSENSSGTAEKKYQSYRESYAFAKNEFHAALEEIANSSEISKLLTDLTKIGTKLVEGIQKILPFMPAIISTFAGFRSLRGKGMLNNFVNLKGSISKMMSGAGAAGQASAAAGGGRFFVPSTMSKLNIGLMATELAANYIGTAVAQKFTAATTHNYNGEKVESSKEAQDMGSTASALISLVPVIGGFIGPIIGEQIAAGIDRDRDRANKRTEESNKLINDLSSVGSSIEKIQSNLNDPEERKKSAEELRKIIFDPEQKKTREALRHHLGDQNLYSVLENIENNTSDSIIATEALITLRKAELEAERDEIHGKYAASNYENTVAINNLTAKIDEYTGFPEKNLALNAGVGAGGTAMAVGGLIGSFIAPGVGTVIGALIGALVGGGAGAGVGYNIDKETALKNINNYSDFKDISDFKNLSIYSQIDEVKKKKEELEKSLSDEDKKWIQLNETFVEAWRQQGWDEETISKMTRQFYNSDNISDTLRNYQNYNELLSLLQDKEGLITTERNEYNTKTEELGFNSATNSKNGKYLSTLSIQELKNLGIDTILTEYAKSIEKEGGLQGINVWNDRSKTRLSEWGYNYLFEKIKAQEDEEINAALSGKSRTLTEVLGMDRSTYEAKKLLDLFADGLRTTVDDLEGIEDSFGMLTLADVNMSTEELKTKMSDLAETMGAVASGAGATSDWMNKIISSYPQFSGYLGNTKELFTQLIRYTKELSNAAVKEQGNALLTNTELFEESIEKPLYEIVGEETASKLRAFGVTDLSSLIKWIQSQKKNDGLSPEATGVSKAMQEVVDSLGIVLTDNGMTAVYDQLSDYRIKTLDYELKNLNEQKESLRDINSEREYENKLIEARLKLEDASKQKKRVYRAGVGWVYEADQEAIKTAQKELDTVNREKQIAVLEEQIAIKEKQKEEINAIKENANYEQLGEAYKAALDETIVSKTEYGAINSIKEGISGIATKFGVFIKDYEDKELSDKELAIKAVEESWNKLNDTGIPVGSDAYNSALQAFYDTIKAAINEEAGEEDFKDLVFSQTGARNIEVGDSAWSVYELGYDKTKMEGTKIDDTLMMVDENGKPYGMPTAAWEAYKKARGFAGGTLSLINELGTEAIVTPQGTLTALPSKTGIIPADITKNLWELGEVAPALLRMFGVHLPSDNFGKSIFDGIGTDESLNIANLVMNVDADSSFDVDKFVAALRARVALTKNSR